MSTPSIVVRRAALLPDDPGRAGRPLALSSSVDVQPTLPLSDLQDQAGSASLGPPTLRAVTTEPLPEPTPWIAQLTLGIVEVLMGRRPVRQLSRWTDQEVYATLAACAGRGFNGGGGPARAQIISVRASQPTPEVIEGVALVRSAGRVRALAVRTEALRRRWVCTSCDVL